MNLKHIKLSLQDYLATTCQCCGLNNDGHGLLCQDCRASFISSNSCIACGKPLPLDTNLCGLCIKQPPVYAQLIAAGAYQFPLQQLIGQFKYQHKPILGQALAELLGDQIAKHYADVNSCIPNLIIPVPLHHQRELERGYNQSSILALALAERFNIAIKQTVLFRVLQTPSQAGLTRKQRKKNLARAFVCSDLSNKHIALVDDVVTTGSTVTEITKTLKKAGAKQVDIWCICRTDI